MMKHLPNALTLARIAAIPLVMGLMVARTPAGDLAASLLFGFAGITDYLDGKLARDWKITSDLGRMLDPIADKLLVSACLMMLVGLQRMSMSALLPAVVIVLREILVSGLREYLASIRIGMPVSVLAKWKTAAQMGAIGFLLAGSDGANLVGLSTIRVDIVGEVLLWIAAGLTVVTGWSYLRLGIHHVVR